MLSKILEVIVTSAAEAIEAERGGADRLEIVRSLAVGGLTPAIHTVMDILDRVAIPVRVMLRDAATFVVEKGPDLALLAAAAERMAALPIDGLVFGSVRDRELDAEPLREITEHVPGCRITFHRAIEALADPCAAIECLKRYPAVDRILVRGEGNDPASRRDSLDALARKAAPEIQLIAGGGVDMRLLTFLSAASLVSEYHVGSAARDASGLVSASQVADLRRILDTAGASTELRENAPQSSLFGLPEKFSNDSC